MRRLLKIALSTFCLLALLQPFSFATQSSAGAKSLFYDDKSGVLLGPNDKLKDQKTGKRRIIYKQSAQVKQVGIHYWLEMENGSSVNESRIFHTGDAIRLRVRSNVPGYLSIWTTDSGQAKQLFPTASNSNNFVQRDSVYTLPGWVRFAPPVQDETLFVFFSRSKNELPMIHSKALNTIAEVRTKEQELLRSKSLRFESESSDATEIGSYVVNINGGAVVKEIRLIHKP